jgi:pimeloyl-ACP methyl ester carboxylesterase
VHEAGRGPAVVFCHGFPDLAYSWRHQVPALAAAGYRAIAPDQRGYGASDRPADVEAYGLTELTGDMVALLDALDVERAVFVGHDWGGFVAWSMPVLHPDRVAGVAGLCTPYLAFPTVDVHASLVGGEIERQYVAWFQRPGVAEAVMDGQVDAIFTRIMRGGVPVEEVMKVAFADGKLNMNPFLRTEDLPLLGEPVGSAEDLALYCEVFGRTGFRGGINWYRNIDRNAREHPTVGTAPLSLPCLMLTAEWDPALPPALAAGMPERCADLEMHMIERAGHWVQQEYPDAVTARLLAWLPRAFAVPR